MYFPSEEKYRVVDNNDIVLGKITRVSKTGSFFSLTSFLLLSPPR
jgi:hypothetical protein